MTLVQAVLISHRLWISTCSKAALRFNDLYYFALKILGYTYTPIIVTGSNF